MSTSQVARGPLGGPPPKVAARAAGVELLVLDVDGVLTDGVIEVDDRGVEIKHFHVRDGTALSLWRRAGRRASILSGRKAAAVEIRAAELGISPVVQGASSKLGPFRALLAELQIAPAQVCYVGDDLADLPVLEFEDLGLAACPSDAIEEVRGVAHVIAGAPGGRGAVREIVEFLLKAQGVWEQTVADYLGATPEPSQSP